MSDQLRHTPLRLHQRATIDGGRLRRASDERLVSAMRRGDERAFEAIYDRYSRPLLGFCRHMLGSREEAEDALQHVFVAAHRQLRDASRPVQLKPWLYAVARNRCISMLRARRQTCELDEREAPSTDGLAVAEEVERREGLAEMLADLARLPDDQRAALLLSELEDLSHEEIGASLDVPVKRVKALVFQARSTLAGWRQARVADCAEIQEQLATLRGSSLRRAPIRRHVAVCEACAQFEREVAHQRAAMALLMPVVPAAALKEGIMAAAGAGSAVTGGAIAAATGGAGLAAKTLAVVAVAVSAGGGAAVAVREAAEDPPPAKAASAPKPATASRPAAQRVTAVASPAAASARWRGKAPATRRARGVAKGRAKVPAGGGNGKHLAKGHVKRPAAAGGNGLAKGHDKAPGLAGNGKAEGHAKVKALRAPKVKAFKAPKVKAYKAPRIEAPKVKAPQVRAPKAKAPPKRTPEPAGAAPQRKVEKKAG